MFKIVLLKAFWEMRNSLQKSTRIELAIQNRTYVTPPFENRHEKNTIEKSMVSVRLGEC